MGDSSNMFIEPVSKDSFAIFCRLLYERHLVTGVGGNVSARFGDRFLVTPSGLSLRDITPRSVLSVQADGCSQKGIRPSKEFGMHMEIFTKRSDVNVVCHVHPPYVIAASTMIRPGSNTLPAITPGFIYFAYPLPMLPFFVPGSVELAKAVRKQFSDKKLRALLLQNHGLITVGTNMTEALNIAEEVDENAMTYVMTSGKASIISNKHISKIF
ncbi:class II aldolase/adducin family protein [bacterium]|nr:class II aldolase/adducin family protein [bacterium]